MGPLAGYKIVELAGIGPCPMAGMLLAELGAEVITIDRLHQSDLGIFMAAKFDLLRRSRPTVKLDLKSPAGKQVVLRLVKQADALIEGFRPGVTERLGLGPDDCAAVNPRLVYGRITGWGQTGPLSQSAGHDLNYIALTGALHSIGRKEQPPTPPLNLVGDFGGGALYLALGVLAAILEAQKSGRGQTVDAAMVDGAASLMTAAYGMFAAGVTSNQRGENILDSGAHFYDVYQTSDGRYVAIAAIEPKFYALLLEKLGISEALLPQWGDPNIRETVRTKLTELIKTKSQAEWCEIFEGSDCCVAPVLDMDQAPRHAHNTVRRTFVEQDGVVQPNAAPRFSRTPTAIRCPPDLSGSQTQPALIHWGFDQAELSQLAAAGVIGN